MDVQPLLDRLHQPRPRRPDTSGLRRLHRAWRTLVPYENLDLQLGRPITLDPDQLMDRFGNRRRGGTCFQSNATLALLLRELGYSVSVVEGAVLRAVRGDQQWGNHIGLLVDTDDGRWLADVGIGDSFLEPLPLREGVHRQDGLEYRLERLTPDIWRVHHHPGGTVASWDISTVPRGLSEYVEPARVSNEALRRVLVAQRHASGRELALRSRLVTWNGPDGSGRRELDSVRDFTDTLVEQFWVPLADFARQDIEVLWTRTGEQYEEWLAIQRRVDAESRVAGGSFRS